MASPPSVVLFDLGGVLIELPAMTSMMVGCPFDETEIRRRWLVSDAVRAFESGRIAAGEFSRQMVREFDLADPAHVFLERFVDWPGGFLPGAAELVSAIRPRVPVALLSNTNALHWSRFERELGLPALFDDHFASHHVGMLKPDAAIFGHVTEVLGIQAGRILFFDDNAVNVDAARAAGFDAHLARGPADARARLESLLD